MNKIVEFLGEYFFGTRTITQYRQHYNFLREFEEGEDLEESSRLLKMNELAYFWAGKIVPNAVDIIALFTDPLLMITGETIRGFFYMVYGTQTSLISSNEDWHITLTEYNDGLDDIQERITRLDETIERIIRESKEGEDWKDNF